MISEGRTKSRQMCKQPKEYDITHASQDRIQ